MNSLSWFIYAADVTGNLQFVLGLIAAIGGLALIMAAIGYVATSGEYEEAEHAACVWLLKRLMPAVVIATVIAAIIPSRNTFYAIAASEVGERIAATDTATDLGKEAVATLKDWLQKQRKSDDSKS